jgi:hypothetical protein
MKATKQYQAYDWQHLTGRTVEVRLGGKLYRQGCVDVVMPDGSGLWLAADTVHSRQYVDMSEGYVLWCEDPTSSRTLPGTSHNATASGSGQAKPYP